MGESPSCRASDAPSVSASSEAACESRFCSALSASPVALGKPERFEFGDLPLESLALKRLLAAARARGPELALECLPAFKQSGYR